MQMKHDFWHLDIKKKLYLNVCSPKIAVFSTFQANLFDNIKDNAILLSVLVREAFKKNWLFSDIDQISFDTHPPSPKDDLWKMTRCWKVYHPPTVEK